MGLAVRARAAGGPRSGQGGPLLAKACDGGSMTGCYHLGLAHETGAGAPRDPAKAAALFTRACEAHQPGACHSLGLITKTAARTPADIARGHSLQGILRRTLRRRLLRSWPPPTSAGAGWRATIRRRPCSIVRPATDGDFRGCTSLGVMYSSGAQMTADPVRAAKAVPRGLRRRRRERLRAPGPVYEQALGAERDMTKAMAAYKKGLRRRPPAELPQIRPPPAHGTVPAERSRPGMQRMQTARDASVGDACFEIGVMYDNAEGVARDRQRALAYYKRGCTGVGAGLCQGSVSLISAPGRMGFRDRRTATGPPARPAVRPPTPTVPSPSAGPRPPATVPAPSGGSAPSCRAGTGRHRRPGAVSPTIPAPRS